MAKKVKSSKTKATKAKAKKIEKEVRASVESVKTVEIEAKLPITDAEARKRGNIAYDKMKERDDLILERKSVANEFKARIDALTSESTKLLMEMRESRELRKVKCREIRNFAKKQVEFHYKGDIVLTRPMIAEDHQEELPLLDNPSVSKVPATTATKLRPRALKPGEPPANLESMHDPVAEAHTSDEKSVREDIASVIQSETSAKSKWSSVDGVC